jgi:SAM-dependent methyltransferase
VLGGLFNALLAPVLFPTVFEYPLTLILACALLPRRAPTTSKRVWDIAWPVIFGVGTVGLITLIARRPFHSQSLNNTIVFGLPPLLCLVFFRRPIRLAACITAVLVASLPTFWQQYHTIYMTRSFFGTHQVIVDAGQRYHLLMHGCIVHGVQSLDPAQRREPLAYYARTSPLADLLKTLPASLKQRVAVVGLGAGTVAAHAERGQHWTFYEIDPTVARIARDPRFFTYLADSPADIQLVLGDARVSLQQAPDAQFGLMLLDAYSSDTPPLHLLTREALDLYLQKLAPDGVLIFHLSTTHLDLKSLLANLARDAGLTALYVIDFAHGPGQAPSRWMALTRQPAALAKLANAGYWRPPRPREGLGVWHDDYISLFRVWNWH